MSTPSKETIVSGKSVSNQNPNAAPQPQASIVTVLPGSPKEGSK